MTFSTFSKTGTSGYSVSQAQRASSGQQISIMLNLNDLGNAYFPGITPEIGKALAQAGSICLDSKGHSPGAILATQGSSSNRYTLQWTPATAQAFRAWQRNRATEWGAEGIAVLLAKVETPYTVIEASVQGEGIDCWLGDEADVTFQRKARLEVSGIRWDETVAEADITNRVRAKLRQTTQSDHTQTPAYVIVVEFSRPVAEVRQK